MTDREPRVDPLGRAAAREAAPIGERPADYAAPFAGSGDLTIEVWSPGTEHARSRTLGFALLGAAAGGLLAASLIRLTRRRIPTP